MKAVKLFALSVGATALCMLGCLGFLQDGEPAALEASIFNGGKEFPKGQESTRRPPPLCPRRSLER